MVSAAKARRASKRYASSSNENNGNTKHQKLSSASDVSPTSDSLAERLRLILELDSALLWSYLSFNDVGALLETFPVAFSYEFANTVSRMLTHLLRKTTFISEKMRLRLDAQS
ncbi:unnamed protein product [Phytophthora lilii]|uniref:Unnamed protein product n=1 Tax=Phytophthora lilii TaxID=2077276 RepID=A0A9W6TT18_9STRA|nr:unnamed protein product [Phytophthora lilii]